MPPTVSSDNTIRNRSIMLESEKSILIRKNKKIHKKYKNMLAANSKQRQTRNCPRNLVNRVKKFPKNRYSPEHVLKINSDQTPLYHSDQYEPCITHQHQQQNSQQVTSYIDMEVLRKMCRWREEEKLIDQLRQCHLKGQQEMK